MAEKIDEEFLDLLLSNEEERKEKTREKYPFLKIVDEIHEAIKEGFLQVDPNNKNNILVYREAGTKYPEGWYSENILEIASELAQDEQKYQNFIKALEEAREEKSMSNSENKKIVNVGYSYAVVDTDEIKNIQYHLVNKAYYEGKLYDIVKADTFEDSQKFDKIMDTKLEFKKDKLTMYSDINKSINNEDKEEKIMENNKENVAEKDFNPGKKVAVAFSKKQVVSERYVTEKKFNDETQRYEPVLNENGEEKKTKELRVKLPNSSELNQFIFTTTENAFEPHKFDKEGKDLGVIDSMLMVKVYENANYKLTRTPYVLDEKGEPVLNEAGKRMLDFENQEVIKISGKDLQREFDSWKTREKEQTQEKKGLNHVQEKGTSSEKTANEPTRKDMERE